LTVSLARFITVEARIGGLIDRYHECEITDMIIVTAATAYIAFNPKLTAEHGRQREE
jgi:hypothetical protein